MVTFAKLRSGEWGLRSDMALHGSVAVTKKSGDQQIVAVGKKVWDGNGVFLYAIGLTAQGVVADSHGHSIRSGASYRAGATAPHGRVCPQCGSRECAKAWDIHDLCDED